MLWVVLIIGIIVIWANISVSNDRKANPEKWAAIDAETAAAERRKAETAYQEAMKRVPASGWMRMSRHEKADVLERREKAAKNRSKLG